MFQPTPIRLMDIVYVKAARPPRTNCTRIAGLYIAVGEGLPS